MATVVFVRDTGFIGSAVYQNLTINEERAAAMDVGEKVTFQLPAGEYVFGIKPTDIFGIVAPFAIEQKLEGGKIYHYRILAGGDAASVRIQRMLNKSIQ